ncbi:MAG: serine hydrolase [Gemmatimonadota bacterium]|nr:MAG: serine hydrolase [Gemmatimonadota bacterium]
MKRLIVLTTVVIIAASPLFSQPFETLNALDGFINQAMEEWKVPGLAVSVIKDGEVIHSKGYGYKDLESKDEVTTKTLFSIASVTKSFTTTAAAMLVDEGIIDWDTPLRDYFPEFRLYDTMASEKATFRDLLCHRTGVGRHEFYELNVPSDRKAVMTSLRYFEPGADFRSAMRYSNWCYTAAGYMLAQLAGMNWERLIQEKIFDPLGMENSLFSVTTMQQSSDYAKPHIIYEEDPEEMEFHNSDIRGPAGSIVSNVEDLTRWVLFHMNKGTHEEKQLVNSQTLAVTQIPHIPIQRPMRYEEKFYQSYGLGWFVDNYRGYVHIHHGGVLYGFSSLVSFLPNEGFGLVILANLNFTPLTTILEGYVYDRLLGLEPADWNQRYLDYYEKVREYYKKMEEMGDPNKKKGTHPSHPLEDYTGTFQSDGYGSITVIQEGDSLRAEMSTDTYPLNHYHYDIFDLYHNIKKMSWKVIFNTNVKGEINSFDVEVEPGLKEVVFTRIEKSD